MLKKIFFLLLFVALGFGFYKNRNVFLVQKILLTNITEYELNEENLNLDSYYLNLISKLNNDFNSFKNLYIWKTPIHTIKTKTLEQKWIDDVKVVRHWPNVVEVQIKTNKFWALIIQKNGKVYPVDKAGELLPEISLIEAPSFPFLRGEEFLKSKELRQKAVGFISFLSNESLFKENLVDISYLEAEGFVATLGWNQLKVKLGFSPNSVIVSRVNQVLEYMKNKNINGKIIDANFSKKVLVKLQN